MIDTHAHLDFEHFNKDRDQVIKRFLNNGGRFIVNIGVGDKRNKHSIKIARKYNKVLSSIGFHPEECDKVEMESAIESLEKLVKNKEVVAIGETGLDYYYTKKNKEKQKKLFEAQLDFARKNKLPVIIHCREAYEDCYEIISRDKYKRLKMVMHCYAGNVNQTAEFLKLTNLMFSFTGNITFPKNEKAEIFEVIKMISIEKIMVETDCPFLAPQAERGNRNEPLFVKYVLRKIAEIKNLDKRKVEEITDNNAIYFFSL